MWGMMAIPPALLTLMIVASLLSPTSWRKPCVMSSVPLTLTSYWMLGPSSRLPSHECPVKAGHPIAGQQVWILLTKSYQKSSGSASLIGRADFPEPALLTNTSTVPNSAFILAYKAFTESWLRISRAWVNTWTFGLRFLISRPAASTSDSFLATRTIAFGLALAKAGANP